MKVECEKKVEVVLLPHPARRGNTDYTIGIPDWRGIDSDVCVFTDES